MTIHQKRTIITEGSYRTFEDLDVYKIARDFRKALYDVSRRLPDIEKFGLASQIRRAAVSLTNNLAEGHGRYHYLDQVRFTLISRGSLEELMDDLNVCEDEHYLTSSEIDLLKKEGARVHQLLNGYLRHLRDRKQGSQTVLRESSPEYGLTDSNLDLFLSESTAP